MKDLSRIPRADYANHPAYGKLFGKPTLLLRMNVLKRFLPKFFNQIRLAVVEKRRPIYSFSVSEEDAHRLPLLVPLVRDGIAVLRLNDQEMAHIRQSIEPSITWLQEHKSSIPPEKRTFKDKVFAIKRSREAQFYKDLSHILERYKVISTLSRYRGIPLAVRRVIVNINDPDDLDWRHRFADIGVSDAKSVYMHFDSNMQSMKCLLYVTPVTADNGPFCHVQGSNRLKTGLLEYATRKANDKSRLDRWDPETRRCFSALPKMFQHKSEFGNDLSDTDPETMAMLERERQFTTDKGNLILFDTDSLHRGGMVKQGRRIMLQIEFEPQSRHGADSSDEGMMGM